MSATGWSRIANDGPPPRELGAAAYDTRRRRLVIHGGLGVGGVQDRKNDTWEWDGATGCRTIAGRRGLGIPRCPVERLDAATEDWRRLTTVVNDVLDLA